MSEFVLSEKSKQDLREIWQYTVSAWSLEQAKQYYNDLIDTCEAIAANRIVNPISYEGIRPGLLGCRKYHHIIFYRILSKNRIRIIRILHERRDFPRHL